MLESRYRLSCLFGSRRTEAFGVCQPPVPWPSQVARAVYVDQAGCSLEQDSEFAHKERQPLMSEQRLLVRILDVKGIAG